MQREGRDAAHFDARVVEDGIVAVTGIVDAEGAEAVSDAVRREVRRGRTHVDVDLGAVDVLLAAAVHRLDEAVREAARAGVEVALVVPPGCVAHRVLDVLRRLDDDVALRPGVVVDAPRRRCFTRVEDDPPSRRDAPRGE